jgi:hypothetical protein
LYQEADLIFALAMVNIRRFWLSSSLILSLLAQQGLSIVFEDTDAPGAVNSLLERGDTSNEDAAYSVFDRLSKDSYYWSGIVSFPWIYNLHPVMTSQLTLHNSFPEWS